MRGQSLEKQILGTFKRALDEGQQDAADHLLRALEALASGEVLGTTLGEAYAYLALNGSHPCPRHRSH